jgi:hypothetical protein
MHDKRVINERVVGNVKKDIQIAWDRRCRVCIIGETSDG